MATYEPVYRVTVFEQDGVTVLTPRAGSPHSDDFKLATASGVTGFFAYLDTPRGRHGRINHLTRKPDTGLITFRTLDIRTTLGGSNLSRFITAFVGDANGREQLGGLKCLVERSTDGAAGTFSDWYTGLIESVQSDGRLWFSFSVRDMSEALKRKLFVDLPHANVTYTVQAPLYPLGMTESFGGLNPIPKALGFIDVGASSPFGDVRLLLLRKDALQRSGPQIGSGVITKTFFDLLQAERTSTGGVRASKMRVRVTVRDGPNAGATGHWMLAPDAFSGAFDFPSFGTDNSTPKRLIGLAVVTLHDYDGNELTGDPNYLAMEGFGVLVDFDVIYNSEPSELTPLFIDDIHPVTLLRDILQGEFGRLSDGVVQSGTFGDTTWSVPFNASDFTSFISDTTWGLFRGIVREEVPDARGWIEKHIMVPFGLGYYYDESGDFRLVDMRRVTSSGSPGTLTTNDLVDGAEPTKRFRRRNAITRVDATYYVDHVIDRGFAIISEEEFPDFPPSLIESYEVPLSVLNFADVSLPEKTFKIDAIGHRAFFNDRDDGESNRKAIEALLLRQIEELKGPYTSGATEHSAEVNIAASALSGLTPGSLLIWDFDEVADPATNLRGGARLVRVTEISPGAIGTVVNAIDLGEDAVAVGPAIAALSALSGSEGMAINVPLTVNAAGDPMQVEFASTATSVGTIPVEASPLWQYGGTVYATGTFILSNLPPGRRIWVRARSLPQDSDELKLPSGWVFPSGADFIDTTGLATPGTPVVSEITGTTALVTWANNETDFQIEVHLDQGGSEIRVSRLRAESTEFLLEFLDNSTAYTVRINYRDIGGGGVSSQASAGFSTTATDPTCPSIDGLVILAGRPV